MLGTDLHSHLIPGVDDGSRGAVETIAMARGLQEMGVTRLHLTPHQYRMGNDFTLTDLRRHVDETHRILARAEIGLELVRSAEYYYGERFVDAIASAEELATFQELGETCVLIELPLQQPAVGVCRVAAALRKRGIRPVMAHPERVTGLLDDRERLDGWREAGWRFQLNLLSLTGHHGSRAADLGHALLEEGFYDFFGSDLHRPSQLESLRRAREIAADFLASETRS
ncbi:MAG: tyrosine-protein phosphatase [Planctomycetaceae bacterium]